MMEPLLSWREEDEKWRCREFMVLLHPENYLTQVIVGTGEVVLRKDLLPYSWKKEA